MDCIVRKLKASVNNANLPVFENVVLKNYVTTTQDGQRVRITDKTFKSDKIKIEILYQTTTVSSIDTTVAGAAQNNKINQKNNYSRAYNQNVGSNVAVTADTDISATINTSDGTYNINGSTGTCTGLVGSYDTWGYLFGSYNNYDSKAGVIKIKSAKFTDLNTNEVITLVPAEVNGNAVFYDADRGVYYGEVNGGTLIAG